MNALFAFLHHLAAFALVGSLATEFVLMLDELTLTSARRLQVADLVYGVSAGLVLVIGLVRTVYFEKGAPHYFHSAPFIAKLSLFAMVGLLSIYPTVEFLSWTRSLRQRRVPAVDARKLRWTRSVIHIELAGVALILLCAALMAKGYGSF